MEAACKRIEQLTDERDDLKQDVKFLNDRLIESELRVNALKNQIVICDGCEGVRAFIGRMPAA